MTKRLFKSPPHSESRELVLQIAGARAPAHRYSAIRRMPGLQRLGLCLETQRWPPSAGLPLGARCNQFLPVLSENIPGW